MSISEYENTVSDMHYATLMCPIEQLKSGIKDSDIYMVVN